MSMKYFRLVAEGTNAPKVYENVYKDLLADCDKNTYFPDVIIKPILLMSTEGMEVLKMYSRTIQTPLRAVKNTFDQSQYMYFAIEPPFVDALSEATVYDKSKLYIEKFVLDYEVIYKIPIFRIKHYNASYVFINLDVAESLLRRGLTGFKLIPVEVM